MENQNESKKNLFNNLARGASNVSYALGNGAKKVVDFGSNIADNQRKNTKNKEIDVKIIEHKYNIGKFVYDNEIDIDDGVVISAINTIDRLVDEITELEGNKNG